MYEATAKQIEQPHALDTIKTLDIRYLQIYGEEVLKWVIAFLSTGS